MGTLAVFRRTCGAQRRNRNWYRYRSCRHGRRPHRRRRRRDRSAPAYRCRLNRDGNTWRRQRLRSRDDAVRRGWRWWLRRCCCRCGDGRHRHWGWRCRPGEQHGWGGDAEAANTDALRWSGLRGRRRGCDASRRVDGGPTATAAGTARSHRDWCGGNRVLSSRCGVCQRTCRRGHRNRQRRLLSTVTAHLKLRLRQRRRNGDVQRRPVTRAVVGVTDAVE
jgi:hypothetical protein